MPAPPSSRASNLDASVDAGPAVDATTMDGGFDGAVADVGGLDGTGGDGSGGDGSACVRPRAICGGTCVDTQTDGMNCGGCDSPTPGPRRS